MYMSALWTIKRNPPGCVFSQMCCITIHLKWISTDQSKNMNTPNSSKSCISACSETTRTSEAWAVFLSCSLLSNCKLHYTSGQQKLVFFFPKYWGFFFFFFKLCCSYKNGLVKIGILLKTGNLSHTTTNLPFVFTCFLLSLYAILFCAFLVGDLHFCQGKRFKL